MNRLMNPNGFSLIELMFVTVIMSILAIAMAQFSATAFEHQLKVARQTESMSNDTATLTTVERDFSLVGFGQPLAVQSLTVTSGAAAQNDAIQLLGSPLVGPRRSQWTYVVQASTAGDTSLTVNCYGKASGSGTVPDPITDITVPAGQQLALQIFNYTGTAQTGLPTDLVVTANSSNCIPGVDFDGNGTADMTQTITLFSPSSVPIPAIPAASLLVPVNGYTGITNPQVTYMVNGSNQLIRTMANGVSAPVLFNVEAFQIQFGYSANDGTFQPGNWSQSPPWDANLRLRAIKLHIVTANPRIRVAAAPVGPITALRTYTPAASTRYFERRHIERIIRTPNALFAHP